MAGEFGAGGRGQVTRIASKAGPVTPEDVWNAAIRAGADPARMALSLCHVLGETTLAECEAGEEDEAVEVEYTLKNGRLSLTMRVSTIHSRNFATIELGHSVNPRLIGTWKFACEHFDRSAILFPTNQHPSLPR